MEPNKIRVLLADDHLVVREGVRKILEMEGDFVIVDEAQDGRQAVAMAKQLYPDVVLMDVAMPLLNGIEATRQILKECLSTRVIILSAHNDDGYVKNATEAGAMGFLLKHTSAFEISQAIRDVQMGKSFYSDNISKRLCRMNPGFSQRGQMVGKTFLYLTSREVEVLQLIAEGKANKETAVELGIHMKTVEKHRQHLMQKLGIHDTAGLTRYAISSGVIECNVSMAAL